MSTRYTGTLKMQTKNISSDIFSKPKWIVNLIYQEGFKEHLIIKGDKVFEDKDRPDMKLLQSMLSSASKKFRNGEMDQQLDLYFGQLKLEKHS